MDISLQFAGQTALVTGGASGIGLACARQLSKAGAHVVVADKNIQLAQKSPLLFVEKLWPSMLATRFPCKLRHR